MRTSSAFAIARRRSAVESSRATSTRPQRTRRGGSPSSARTAYPIPVVPGSMPRTAPALGVLQHLDRDVEVGVHLLHVVELFQALHQAEDLLRSVALEAHRVGGTHADLGRGDRDARGLD